MGCLLAFPLAVRALLGFLPLHLGATAPPPTSELQVPAYEVRREWFGVSRVPASATEGHAAPDGLSGEPVAVLRLLRLDAADHTLLERDVVWRHEGWRMHHTERLSGTYRRLCRRELGPSGARAWLADWDLGDPAGGRRAQVVGHGWARPTHEHIEAGAPWIGPLEWLEAARGGALAAIGEVAWLDPQRAASGAPPHPVRRSVDGSASGGPAACDRVGAPPHGPREVQGPEGRATFAGDTLVAFDLGAPGLRATPITEAEYERLAGRWAHRPAARHRFVEAALRRDDTLRRLAELGPRAFAAPR